MPATAEQAARDMLERMGMESAQSLTAGDVVELANLIAQKPGTPRCATCKHWVSYLEKYPNGILYHGSDVTIGGICQSLKLAEASDEERQPDMLVYTYDEGGKFWTGPEFGCVHHQPKGEPDAR